MSQSLLGKAFLAGIVSACSMPLGSLTAFFWHPRSRILAFLMAFGGGALLAALVIDLVGSPTEKGHLLELVAGTIAESLLFTLLKGALNIKDLVPRGGGKQEQSQNNVGITLPFEQTIRAECH